jgi:hypothetical protein
MAQQPDLYLHLSQILEYEISNHLRTQAELVAETTRRSELKNEILEAVAKYV